MWEPNEPKSRKKKHQIIGDDKERMRMEIFVVFLLLNILADGGDEMILMILFLYSN